MHPSCQLWQLSALFKAGFTLCVARMTRIIKLQSQASDFAEKYINTPWPLITYCWSEGISQPSKTLMTIWMNKCTTQAPRDFQKHLFYYDIYIYIFLLWLIWSIVTLFGNICYQSVHYQTTGPQDSNLPFHSPDATMKCWQITFCKPQRCHEITDN